MRTSSIPAAVLAACLAATPLPAWAHGDEAHAEEAAAPVQRVLGEISFPTSTESAEAQSAFIRGMLLLHLFEYPFARDEFIQAQALDPDFALAYWGEAMTHNHPIWDEQDLEAGRAALAKLGATPQARLASTPVLREQGLVAAVDALYGEGSKAERDRLYLQAMERLAAAHPEDHEIQLFHALALFGVQAGVRDTATYMRSTAIAQDVFSENPRHPGAAHYLIHGVDDPLHAVLGLRAARALAEMAPDAGHAQHMASHIFLAVGLWNDVVAVNESAVRVQNAMRAERGEPARHWGHYNYWLLYGLLQQGRRDDALALLKAAYEEAREAGKSPEDPLDLEPDRSQVGSVVQMWLRYLVETRDWGGEVAAWSFLSGDAFDPNLNISFARAMQAADAGLVAQAGQFRGQFQALQAELGAAIRRQAEPAPTDLLYLQRLAVLDRLLAASIEMARGEKAAAAAEARAASEMEAAMPHSFGPPFVDLQPAEYLGESLLASGDAQGAAAAFREQLARTPLKRRALEGLARAQEAQGQEQEAAYTRSRLAGPAAAATGKGRGAW